MEELQRQLEELRCSVATSAQELARLTEEKKTIEKEREVALKRAQEAEEISALRALLFCKSGIKLKCAIEAQLERSQDLVQHWNLIPKSENGLNLDRIFAQYEPIENEIVASTENELLAKFESGDEEQHSLSSKGSCKSACNTPFPQEKIVRLRAAIPGSTAAGFMFPPCDSERFYHAAHILVAARLLLSSLACVRKDDCCSPAQLDKLAPWDCLCETTTVQPVVATVIDMIYETLQCLLRIKKHANPVVQAESPFTSHHINCGTVSKKNIVDRTLCLVKDEFHHIRPSIGETPVVCEVKVTNTDVYSATLHQSTWYLKGLVDANKDTPHISRTVITTNLSEWSFNISVPNVSNPAVLHSRLVSTQNPLEIISMLWLVATLATK
jgi:hypothetical protein